MGIASQLDDLSLDLLSSLQEAAVSSEVAVGGSVIVQALVIAPVIVVLDEVGDGNGEPKYIAPRESGIGAWFGETLDQLKMFDLSA